MGDGTVRRVAVIIDGSNEQELVNESSEAATFLSSKGYDLFMAAHRDSAIPSSATRYPPTLEGVKQLADALAGKTDDDDEVVIVTGGHGNSGLPTSTYAGGQLAYLSGDCLVMSDGCLSKDADAFTTLFSLPAGRRTVVMGQCYSGNWASKFFGDPRTLFVSAGPRNQIAYSNFIRGFFRDDAYVDDLNKDGMISWQERYAGSIKYGERVLSSFLPGKLFVDMGANGTQAEAPRFASKAHEVKARAEYDELLATLGSGDYAFINVSSPNYASSRDYNATFDRLAREAGGRALFVTIANGDAEAWDHLGINAFPTVLVTNARGFMAPVKNRRDPVASIPLTHENVWKDPKSCLQALASYEASALPLIDRSLWKDRDFVFEATRRYGEAFRYADGTLKNDRHFVLKLVTEFGNYLEHAGAEVKRDRQVVRAAVKSIGQALRFADPVLRRDKEIIFEALRSQSSSITDADEGLQKDRAFILEAVTQAGGVLDNVDEAFKKDPDVVRAAVKANYWAFRYADKKLTQDRAFVLEMVRENGKVLSYVDPVFTRDAEIVLAAMENDPAAIELADASLRSDPEILKAAKAARRKR